MAVSNIEISSSAIQHGHDLLRQGFTVSQVVHSYGDVCQVITELAVQTDAPMTIDEFRTLNRCLDDAIAGAVTEYGRARNQSTLDGENAREQQRLGFFAHELGNLIQSRADGVEARVQSGDPRWQVDPRPHIPLLHEDNVRTGFFQPEQYVYLSSYIFGYTMEMDVSDREARGDNRYGSDWLIAKSRDTFAPLGPFIMPKEFAPDPKNLPVKFTLNGRVMQDASTSLMIHDVFELVTYASRIVTLRAGDVLATGTPAGVGSARSPAVFLKAGDKTSCTYEGVGTLNSDVR